MNFVGEWFGKFISSERQNQGTNGNDLAYTIDTNYTETSEMNNERSSIASTVVDGFNSIVASVRSSISENPRLQNLFNDGTVTANSDTLDVLRHSRSSAPIAESIKEWQEIDKAKDIIVRRKAKTCETTRRCMPEVDIWEMENDKALSPRRRKSKTCDSARRHTAGGYIWKFDRGEKTPSLRRSRANSNLNAVAHGKRDNDSIMVVPAEDEIADSDHSDVENNEVSFLDKIRNRFRSLRMNIALRHRRHEKREKRKQRADYYRKKYSTNESESFKATQLIEDEVPDSGKSTVSRLFDIVRAKCAPRRKTRTELARDRVAIKMEQRKQMYAGQSRIQIVTHMKGKYKKGN